MSLLGFKARFAGPVERREKRQTIRAKVNGHAAFGRHHVIASRQIDIGVLRLQSHDTTASAPSDEH